MEGKHPGYFQGILQLRNPSKKLKEFVDKEIKENNIYVAKTKNVKDGIDMHISSNKFLMKLGRKLKQEFSGDMKISKKLFSRDRMTQKEIWRMTLVFREMPFKRGDIVNIRGEEYKISSLGTKVQCTNVKTGKKKLFDYSEVN